MRRAAVISIGAAALMTLAPAAQAQDVVPPEWTASAAVVEGTRLSGAMQRDGTYWKDLKQRPFVVTVTIGIAAPLGQAEGCTVPSVEDSQGTTTAPFDHVLAFDCNGTYQATITGTANAGGGTAILQRAITVAMPPPVVTGAKASRNADDGTVTITWDDASEGVPDLTGYRVEGRSAGDHTTLAELDDPHQTSFTDDEVPADAQTLSYRIVATRVGTSASPTGSGSEASLDLTDPTQPGDPAGPTDPGTDPSAPGGPAGGARKGRIIKAPRLGIKGTFLPPVLGSSRRSGRSTTPTTLDTGFDEDLPYDAEPGEEHPVLPDDEMAAFFHGGEAGRGLLIPVATAVLLAVWAFHLRYLARAARPAE